MNHDLALVSLAWTSVYAGLSAFFLVVAPRFRGRGYDYLGVAMAGVAVATFGTWLALSSGPSWLALLGGRLLIVGAAFSPALNTQFILLFTRLPRFERHVFWAYVLAGGAVLADVICAVTVDRQTLAYPREYISTTPALSVFITVTFAVHLVVSVAALWHAVRRGQTGARLPLLLVTLLGPAVAYDFGTIIRTGDNYFITEPLTWIYGLVVVGVLLTELRGKEGLLERTTSSLAERTEELKISYAELDLMHTELSQKEQLAAVGELAASIAHEVRNPLAIIMNAASGLRRKTITNEDKETLLSIVDEESARLNQLVTELLRFARPVTAARAAASLVDICEQVQRAAPDGVEIPVERPRSEGFAAVWVDPGLFRLALDNLTMNAVQAMQPGGKIDIAIRNARLSDGGAAAAVEVRDYGHGMSQADLERARKPFFTTKPRGTGLGLPIVDRIIEAHGGIMEIESEPGKGTVVTLVVPFADPNVGRYPGSKSPSQRRRFRSFHDVDTETSVHRDSELPEAPAPEGFGPERRSSDTE